MTAPQGVPIARIPTGQSVDLFTAVGHLLDTALGGAMLAQGNGHDVAATVIARDGQTERQAVTALRRAAEALGAEDLAPLVDGEPDEGEPGVTVGPLRHDERGWTASLGGTAVEVARQVMAVLVPAFEEHPEAMNYLSWDATYGPTGQRYSLILVRPDGLTPHEARQRAEQEAERLASQLAAAAALVVDFRQRAEQTVVTFGEDGQHDDNCDSPAECHAVAQHFTWKLAARALEKALAAGTSAKDGADRG